MEWTAETIYATITITTSLILLLMVLMGGDADVDADVDMDVDMDMDVDADVDVDVDVAVAGPGHFGLKLLLGFVIGFGLGGFLAKNGNWDFPHHLLAGLVGGLCVYTLEYQLLKVLFKQQANTQTRASTLRGRGAVVSHPIGKGLVGEVRAVDPQTGRSIYLRARAADAEAEFGDGAEVKIRSVGNGMATVE